jgi:hypothetical protein
MIHLAFLCVSSCCCSCCFFLLLVFVVVVSYRRLFCCVVCVASLSSCGRGVAVSSLVVSLTRVHVSLEANLMPLIDFIFMMETRERDLNDEISAFYFM